MPVYLLSSTYIARVYKKTTNYQNRVVKSVRTQNLKNTSL